MAIIAGLRHLTHYRYDRPVTLGPQIIRLRPAPHSRTRVISHSLKVTPVDHFVNHQQDPYGNWLARFVFPEPVRELKIEVDLVADMTVYNPFDFFVDETAKDWPFDYPADHEDDLSIYRRTGPAGPRLRAFLDSIPKETVNTVDFVVGQLAPLGNGLAFEFLPVSFNLVPIHLSKTPLLSDMRKTAGRGESSGARRFNSDENFGGRHGAFG